MPVDLGYHGPMVYHKNNDRATEDLRAPMQTSIRRDICGASKIRKVGKRMNTSSTNAPPIVR
jgi:hypothetical protein